MKDNEDDILSHDDVELAVSRFHSACNHLATLVNRQLFDNLRDWYWVDGMVGGTCDFEDTDFLAPEEMVLILRNNMTYDEYAEWRDANTINGQYINLESWLYGCRHSMLGSRIRRNPDDWVPGGKAGEVKREIEKQ